MANLEKPEHLGYFVGRFNVYRATSNHIEGKAIFNYMLKKKWYQRPIRMKVIANKDSKWKNQTALSVGEHEWPSCNCFASDWLREWTNHRSKLSLPKQSHWLSTLNRKLF